MRAAVCALACRRASRVRLVRVGLDACVICAPRRARACVDMRARVDERASPARALVSSRVHSITRTHALCVSRTHAVMRINADKIS
jgi:hypothetical protein